MHFIRVRLSIFDRPEDLDLASINDSKAALKTVKNIDINAFK